MHTLFFVLFYQESTGMAFVFYNPNPTKKLVGDCVIRAISKVTGQKWEQVHFDLCVESFEMDDMPSSNAVWGAYLYKMGFRKYVIPDTCPDCYSVKRFCQDHPRGTYLIATGTHVIAVKNGNYYDTWDSGDEVPIYYFRKEYR